MSLFTTNFSLEESIEIQAPLDKIWEQLIDAKKGKIWSPWLMLESKCEHTVEGKKGELGYREYRNGKVIGEGEGILKDIKQGELVQYELNFFKPFKSYGNIATFLIQKLSKDSYKITWTLDTSLPIFLFFMKKSMIGMIAADFRRGLVMLKDIVETGKLETSTDFIGTDTFDKKFYIAKKGNGSVIQMSKNMGNDFGDLFKTLGEKNIESMGGFTIYDKSDITKDYFEYQACVIVSEDDYTTLSSTDLNAGIYLDIYEETQVAKITHTGDYKYLANSWTGGFMYLKPNGLKQNKKRSPFEFYEIGPHNCENPSEYKTHIGIPIK